jgi:hypothetical protein
MVQRPGRIDYLRHDSGRAADSPTASRFIEARTASARQPFGAGGAINEGNYSPAASLRKYGFCEG